MYVILNEQTETNESRICYSRQLSRVTSESPDLTHNEMDECDERHPVGDAVDIEMGETARTLKESTPFSRFFAENLKLVNSLKTVNEFNKRALLPRGLHDRRRCHSSVAAVVCRNE